MITYVNARFLTQPQSGVQRYAFELISALDTRWDPARRGPLVAYMPAGAAMQVTPNWRHVSLGRLGGGTGHLWEQGALLHATRNGRLLSLCNAGPLLHPAHVVAMHDAHVCDYPEAFSRGYRYWHRWLRPRLARRAKALFTVSPYAAHRLSRCLGVAPDTFDVVPNAAEHLHRVTPDIGVLQRLGLVGQRYFLTVGNQSPIKNLARLAAAHADLPRSAPPLVTVGGALPLLSGKSGTPSGSRVIAAGRVSDGALRALYENAAAFVFPSLDEGFGIPPLEAQMLGVPVIAARAGALPWVLGNAALWFAHSTQDIAKALERFLTLSASEIVALRHAGHANSARFSWARSAAVLEAVLDQVQPCLVPDRARVIAQSG